MPPIEWIENDGWLVGLPNEIPISIIAGTLAALNWHEKIENSPGSAFLLQKHRSTATSKMDLIY